MFSPLSTPTSKPATSPSIYPSPPQSPIQADEDLEQQFNEALLLSVAIGITRGDKPERKSTPSGSSTRSAESSDFRKFIDSLAYLCDYARRGKSVTSIAVQQTPDGLVYHFATNLEECSEEVESFLINILGTLEHASTRDKIAQEVLEEKILKLVLDHNPQRIRNFGVRISQDLPTALRKDIGFYRQTRKLPKHRKGRSIALSTQSKAREYTSNRKIDIGKLNDSKINDVTISIQYQNDNVESLKRVCCFSYENEILHNAKVEDKRKAADHLGKLSALLTNWSTS